MKIGNQWDVKLCGVDPASIAAYAAVASAVVGAGSAVYSASQNKTPTQKKVPGVNTDAATAQADEELRKRSRQGINANLLSGTGGAGSPGTTSTGQKSLLGG
ncbi:MAG: hypothetical protein QM578_12485 [Pantoea sp.]|uniref:hypothetical protein n=1 Tax=Pantoea sp. TaxID=69393 RepID=UPI0039E672CF